MLMHNSVQSYYYLQQSRSNVIRVAATGECLEQPELKLVKFEVRKQGEQVQVLAPLAIAS